MKPVTDFINRWVRKLPAWTIYVGSATWVGWLFYLAATGQNGPDPVNTLERSYGAYALKLIVAVLAITPMRRYLGINLLKFRRAIGVSAFFVVLAHFSVWAILDVQSLARVWADIVKRPYVTIGMGAFVMMLPLAITSNNLSLRKLGGGLWRKIHWLTYPAAVLGAIHYVWLVKGWPAEPFVYTGIILALLALRLKVPAQWKARRAVA